MFSSNIVEASDLSSHSYLVRGRMDRSGLLFSCRGGFLDIGHLRDAADTTAFVATEYFWSGGVGVTELPADASDEATAFRVTFTKDLGGRPIAPVPHALAAMIGQRVAYDRATWHEMATYFSVTPGGRNSSFSPEDNYSNALGTFVGFEALLSGFPWNVAVVEAMRRQIGALTPVSHPSTTAAFRAVAPTWTSNSSIMLPDYLQRRHMAPFGAISPWRAPCSECAASGAPQAIQLPTSFDWGVTRGGASPLTDYYDFEVEATPRVLSELGGISNPVHRRDFPSLLGVVKDRAKKDFGPRFDKPA